MSFVNFKFIDNIPNMLRLVHKKFAAWMAIFGLLLSFFAPAITQAMPQDSSGNLIYQKVCSESGSKLVPVEIPTHHQDSSLNPLGHCLFCCSNHQAPAVFANAFVLPVQENHQHDVVSTLYQAPLLKFTFQPSHPPQAPPTFE